MSDLLLTASSLQRVNDYSIYGIALQGTLTKTLQTNWIIPKPLLINDKEPLQPIISLFPRVLYMKYISGLLEARFSDPCPANKARTSRKTIRHSRTASSWTKPTGRSCWSVRPSHWFRLEWVIGNLCKGPVSLAFFLYIELNTVHTFVFYCWFGLTVAYYCYSYSVQ